MNSKVIFLLLTAVSLATVHTIFILCEPFILSLIYPAPDHNIFALIPITSIFLLITLIMVFVGVYGLGFITLRKYYNAYPQNWWYFHIIVSFSISILRTSVVQFRIKNA